MEEQKPPLEDKSNVDSANPEPASSQNKTVAPAEVGVSNTPNIAAPEQPVHSSELPSASPVVVSDPAYASTAKKRVPTKLLMPIGVGVIIIAVLVVTAVLTRKTKTPIVNTSSQTSQPSLAGSIAKSAAESMINDTNVIANDITSTNSPATLSAELAQDTQIKSDLTDAQNQYAKLESPSVKTNKSIDADLVTLTTKWTPYSNFINEYVSDDQAIAPVIFPFLAGSQSLTQQPTPTTASELNTYLDNFKSLYDTTLPKLQALKLILTANQSAVNVVETYLSSSSSLINSAQIAVQQGDYTAVASDLEQIDGTSLTTMQNGLTSATTAINSQEEQLNPSTTITSILAVL